MSWRPPTPPMRSCSRIWRERSENGNGRWTRPTPVAWAPARGLVAHYPFDGDLAPQVAVLHETRNRATGSLAHATLAT